MGLLQVDWIAQVCGGAHGGPVGAGADSACNDTVLYQTDVPYAQAWRVLSRSPLPPNLRRNPEDAAEGGAHICYTPMINARHFSEGPGTTKYTEANFNEAEGGCCAIGSASASAPTD